ncbi:DHH family phosphoesterase [Candidatus Uhrbacteria bacterium]|nr:DHH family phosphoesterase [Candidatus Uhrbacteria bacterium]
MEYLIYRQIWDAVKSAKHCLLISHKKPDGDTLGAMLAFGNALEAAGRPHTRFCADEAPTPYRFMPGNFKMINSEKEALRSNPDLILLFDAGDLAFAGVSGLVSKIQPRPAIINIDHHHTNTRFGDINAVATDAASTTEVVHRLLAANNIEIDQRIATCLLTGLCTDTGNFTNPATTPSALRLGGELLTRGAKFGSIFRALWKNKSANTLKLWGLAMERLRYDRKNETATTVLFDKDLKEHGVPEEATEGISNFFSAVLNVPIILVLRETNDGKVKGSYRTTGDDDVSALAAKYGGGGHKKAAGFTVAGNIEELPNEWKVKIRSPLDKY